MLGAVYLALFSILNSTDSFWYLTILQIPAALLEELSPIEFIHSGTSLTVANFIVYAIVGSIIGWGIGKLIKKRYN